MFHELVNSTQCTSCNEYDIRVVFSTALDYERTPERGKPIQSCKAKNLVI